VTVVSYISGHGLGHAVTRRERAVSDGVRRSANDWISVTISIKAAAA